MKKYRKKDINAFILFHPNTVMLYKEWERNGLFAVQKNCRNHRIYT